MKTGNKNTDNRGKKPGEIKDGAEIAVPTGVRAKMNRPARLIPKETRTEDIRRGIRSVTDAPTKAPRNFYESLLIYRSGGTNRLYIYDADNAEWLYETLTT